MQRRAVALFILPALAAAAQVFAAVPSTWHLQSPGKAVSACEAARLSSWFEAQRQITDGDVDPARVVVAPIECIRADARAESAPVTNDHRADARPGRAERGVVEVQNGA